MKLDLKKHKLPCDIDLVLVIGIPGTGKSTFAKQIANEYGFTHLEADQYFIDAQTGNYVFDKNRLNDAHEWCFEKTKSNLKFGNKVVVSNTFLTRKSREMYLALGYKSFVHTATGSYSTEHKISKEILEEKRNKWQPFDIGELLSIQGSITDHKADLRYNWPITVLWGQVSDGYKSSIFINSKLQIIEPFTRYCLNIANMNAKLSERSQAHKSKIDKATETLKSLASFMRLKRLNWDEITDFWLEEYRNWELDRVTAKSSSRNDLTRKRSVNIKLKEIYNFYYWAQEETHLVLNYIGWKLDSKIQSKLPLYMQNGAKEQILSARKHSLIYPLTYPRVGSSNDSIDYIASQADKVSLRTHFLSSPSDHVSQRNILIMDLADAVGWRQGSINSLTITQFSDEVIERSEESVIHIKPAEQKLGYQFDFEVPLALAIRINRYIKTIRNEFLNRKNSKKNQYNDKVFLSEKTANPLADQTITQIFSKAFKAIGCPKGSGIHSFRRKFTNDETRLEIETRKKSGLSTAPEDVMLPIARRLGQKSISSQQVYADATRSLTNDSAESNLKSEILKLESELANRDMEIAALKKLLDP